MRLIGGIEVIKDAFPTYTKQGDLTFYGVWKEYQNEITSDWSEAYFKQSERYLEENIIPNMRGHDNKAIGKYTKKQYDTVISTIRKKYPEYADGTIQSHLSLMRDIVKVAARHLLCEFVIRPEKDSGRTEHRETAVVRKSLTTAQAKIFEKNMFTDYRQAGEKMGLVLMYALGLRNSEAAAIIFGDIVSIPADSDNRYLIMHWSVKTESKEREDTGKTDSAIRYIPIHPQVDKFLLQREKYVEEEIAGKGKQTDVKKMTIACMGNDLFTPCLPEHLSRVGKLMLADIMKDEQLYFIEQLQQMECSEVEQNVISGGVADESTTGIVVVEKDLTNYVLRRNFATQMKILGLEDPEIYYVMGHLIEGYMYIQNADYSNEELLTAIKAKMDDRPLYRAEQGKKAIPAKLVEKGKPERFRSRGPKEYLVSASAQRIRIHVETKEPGDSISIKIASSNDAPPACIEREEYYTEPQEYPRTFDNIKEYQKEYEGGRRSTCDKSQS